MKSWKKREKKTTIILFRFILSAGSRKPFQSQLSKLSFCYEIRSKVSRTRSRSVVSAPESSKTPVTDEYFTTVQNFIESIMKMI